MLRASILRATTAVALGGLSSSACIIVASDGDTDDPTLDPSDTGNPSGTGSVTQGPTDTGNGDAVGETGVEPPPGNCSDNLIGDPGFEGGTPNASWSEVSDLFGTPICDSSCADMPGADPHSGSWWAWFGGLADAADFATVSQEVTLPAADAIQLSFWLQIRSGSGTGADFFAVSIDDQQIFSVSDLDMATYANYTLVELDITDFGNDALHTLYFDGDIAGVGLSSFFLDDVSLYACNETASTTGSVDSTGGGSTSADSTGGTDGSTGGSTGGTTGGSTGGSTGGTGGSTGGSSSTTAGT